MSFWNDLVKVSGDVATISTNVATARREQDAVDHDDKRARAEIDVIEAAGERGDDVAKWVAGAALALGFFALLFMGGRR